jgi:hypothetical protein
MERSIYRGTTLIGALIFPAESGAPVFGMEVLALSEFGNVDPDADTQFESADRAEDFLHEIYEIRCRMLDITPEPRAPKPVELDEEAAYYAREAEKEAAEYAHYVAQSEQFPVESLESQGEPDIAAPERVDGDTNDDFPF